MKLPDGKELIFCKNCKYFEYDSVAKVDGIPLIVAHEFCKRWGDGCKTSENGYCFLAEKKSEEMTLTEFMDERYKNREDKDNMYGVGVSDSEFRKFIIDYLLGEDWYIVDPLGQTQINEIALCEILEKYSKRYRKECKRRKRGAKCR